MHDSTINIARTLFTVENPSAFLDILEIDELRQIVKFFATYIPEAVSLNESFQKSSKDLIIQKLIRIVERVHTQVEDTRNEDKISRKTLSFSNDQDLNPDGYSIGFLTSNEMDELKPALPNERKSHMPFALFYAYLGRQAALVGREAILRKIESLYSINPIIYLEDGNETSAREVIGYYSAGIHEVNDFTRTDISVGGYTRKAGNTAWYIAPEARGAILKELGLVEFLPEHKKDWLTATEICAKVSNNHRTHKQVIAKITTVFEQLIAIKHKKISVNVDDAPKRISISELVSLYRTEFGSTYYCSPLLLDFVIKTLDIPTHLPSEHEWLSVTNCCKALRLVPTPERILKIREFFRELVAQKSDEFVTTQDGIETEIKSLVGRFIGNRYTGYYIRKDAIGIIITKEDISPKKQTVNAFDGKNKEDYIPSSKLCQEAGVETNLVNLYATRKLLQELQQQQTKIDGINVETDILKVSGKDRGEGKGCDVYYIKLDKAHLINSRIIKERMKDIRLWELELLELASKSRTDPETIRARQ